MRDNLTDDSGRHLGSLGPTAAARRIPAPVPAPGRPGKRLLGKRILIVEDEYLLAMDLADYFTRMGAEVVGPVATVQEARRQVERAEAAVLDIDLGGENVFPIADELARRSVPFVFFTGCQDLRLPERFRHVGFLSKPANWESVWKSLFPEDEPADASGAEDVTGVLPKLRLSARLIMRDAAAADRLLELALEQALAEVHLRPADTSLEAWLGTVLEDVSRRYGPDLMN